MRNITSEVLGHKQFYKGTFSLRQRDIEKTFKAAKNAGSPIARMEINPETGVVVFICGNAANKNDHVDDYISWRSRRQ